MSGVEFSLKVLKNDLGLISSASPHNIKMSGYGRAVERIRTLFMKRGDHLAGIGKKFNEALGRLERIPIKFTAEGNLSPYQSIDLFEYLSVAEALEGALEKSQNRRAQCELKRLRTKVMGLRYRMELDSKQTEISQNFKEVAELADQWKRKKHIFDYKPLSANDTELLSEACRFKGFAQLLIINENLREAFFLWTIRDHNRPAPFVQFPEMCKKLMDSRLAARIGFYNPSFLKIEKVGNDGLKSKELTLPFEGKQISILNPKQKVELKKGYVLTIKQIFKSFIDKEWEIGNLEFLSDGIGNWNSKQLGSYNGKTKSYERINLAGDSWWEEFPVVKELTIEEACMRYDLPCDGKSWVVTINASRQNPSYDPGTHAHLEVAIPFNNVYRIYNMGKFSDKYPRKWYEYIDTLVGTFKGVIVYPDENIFYTDRQHRSHSALASPVEGSAIMASIRKNIIYSRRGDLAFQFLSENCSRWAWKKARKYLGPKRIPDLFRVKFMDALPTGALGKLLRFAKKLPHYFRWLFLTSFAFLLGAWKGRMITKKNGRRKRISLLSDLPWGRRKRYYHPAQLFHNKRLTLV